MEVRRRRLSNGLQILVLENRRAPLVVTALFYRAGSRDDPAGQGGLAHFLEHMMFKGSQGYPAGEVDRLTQAWGGTNNAYTTHDTTVYTFSFSSDRWRQALAIELDRQRGLTLDPAELERERGVIQEELRLYEDQPWDSLEKRVHAELFSHRGYGRPIVGSRKSVASIRAGDLDAFHRRHYGADSAILVLAGDVGPEALDLAGRLFEGARTGVSESSEEMLERPRPGVRRLEQRKGEVPRLLLGLPAPSADDPDYAPLRLLYAVLASGRTSRLGRDLVDEGQLCSACSAEISEMQGPGLGSVWAELAPGTEPQAVEEALLEHLRGLCREPPSAAELERARTLLLADWAFGIETVGEQAMVMGVAAALFDLEYPVRHLHRLLAAGRGQLLEVARRYLDPDRGAVLGWSLPAPVGARQVAPESA